MQKGKTYHLLLGAYVESVCEEGALGTREDLEPEYPGCADLKLAKAICQQLPDGGWQVDLIVKQKIGSPGFRRQPLKRCRNLKEARIVASYAEKVMEPAGTETGVAYMNN